MTELPSKHFECVYLPESGKRHLHPLDKRIEPLQLLEEHHSGGRYDFTKLLPNHIKFELFRKLSLKIKKHKEKLSDNVGLGQRYSEFLVASSCIKCMLL